MPVVSCPFPGCSYATEDINETLASTLLQIHASGAHNSAAATPSSSRQSTTGLIDRARALIQNSALPAINQASQSATRIAMPNHPNRVSFRGKKRKLVKTHSHEVQSLNPAEGECKTCYPLTESCVRVNQVMVNLTSEMSEQDIRQTIVSACQSVLPNLTKEQFDFVKRDKGKIYTPIVESSYKFDYPQLKKLIGQGKIYVIYVRLLDEVDSDSDESLPPLPFEQRNNQQPGSSSNTLPGGEAGILDRLTEIFPDTPIHKRIHAACHCATIAEAVNWIVIDSECKNDEQKLPEDVENHLTKQFFGKERIRISVDADCALESCIAFFKSDRYDPSKPIRVVFDGQPGVDGGGLLRQFYSTVNSQLTASNSTTRLFEGSEFNTLPKSTSETCLSEIFIIIGKIFSHNICQGGEGFPYLALPIYMYLVTGSINESMIYAKVEDIANPVYQIMIRQVQDAFFFFFWEGRGRG